MTIMMFKVIAGSAQHGHGVSFALCRLLTDAAKQHGIAVITQQATNTFATRNLGATGNRAARVIMVHRERTTPGFPLANCAPATLTLESFFILTYSKAVP